MDIAPQYYTLQRSHDSVDVDRRAGYAWDSVRAILVAALVGASLMLIGMTSFGGKRGPTSLHEASVVAATCVTCCPAVLAAAPSSSADTLH